MDDADDTEQELERRQPDGLRPIGRALRSTYDADNHDSLGNDLTGLMLELARVGDEPLAIAPPPSAPIAAAPLALPPPAPPAMPPLAPPPSWLRRLFGRPLS